MTIKPHTTTLPERVAFAFAILPLFLSLALTLAAEVAQ